MSNQKITLILFYLFLGTGLYSQVLKDTLYLTLPEAEKNLLQNNLPLLAEELNIAMAKAEVIQAKVWPNPTLSIENVNPYTTSYQRRHAEEQASLFGSESLGKYHQIEIQLEQVVSLAGKHRKRRSLAEVAVEEAEAYLADFLWDLKTEFRKTVYNYTYTQQYLGDLQKRYTSIGTLINASKNQYQRGNLSKMELIRLQALKVELHSDILELQTTLEALQGTLSLLLNQPNRKVFSFELEEAPLEGIAPNYNKDDLFHLARTNRPKILLSELHIDHASKEYDLERSQRIPDVGVALNYDRGGGIYPDYIGLGIALDLPFFNTNKGNIKKAALQITQKEYQHEHLLQASKNALSQKHEEVLRLAQFLENTGADYLLDLDNMMKAYTQYFKERSIDITTYMDFLEAYLENKKTVLQRQKEYRMAIEDINRLTGIELIEMTK